MKKNKLANQKPNATDVITCTCANLRRATRIVTQVYDASLQPTGLRATQFTLLATLANRGELPLSRLADVLVMDRTTLTRNLKPLVQKGWIRIDHGADQRVRQISLTDDGKRVFQDALPYWQQAQTRLVESLGYDRWATLLDDLVTTVGVIQDD